MTGDAGRPGQGSDAHPGPDRAEAMARRLDRTARRLGVDPGGRQRIGHAFRVAMEPRRERVPDDHHPDYLHPARTALILMDDARVTDPELLVTALLLETRDPELAVDREGPPPGVRPEALERVARVPGAAGAPAGDAAHAPDRRLEALLALPPGLLMVAVAERLDHARHLHLRDRAEWAPYHALTRDAYAPAASRTHPKLAQRLRYWCETFSSRFLGT